MTTPAALTDARTQFEQWHRKEYGDISDSARILYSGADVVRIAFAAYAAALARAPAVPREPTHDGPCTWPVGDCAFAAPAPAAAPAPERHLTRDEQQMLSRALRNSARRLSPEVEAAIPENRAELYEPAPAPVVDELVQRLRNLDYGAGLAHEAADAIAALRAENARLTRERDALRLAVKDDAQWAQENERLTRERDEWKTKCGDANIWGLRNSAAWKDRAERLAAALRKLFEAISRVCTATDGIGVINAVAELRPLLPETRGIIYDYERDALAGEDGK